MKKFVLPLIGGSLFIAGYYHVHQQAATLGPKPQQTGFAAPNTPASPASLFSFKTLPAFAFSN
ncbi:hypothetical protein [Spirosoma aerophilum]